MSSSASDSAIFHAVDDKPDDLLAGRIQPIHVHRQSRVLNWAAIGILVTVAIGFATVIYQRGKIDNKVENIEVNQKKHATMLEQHSGTLHTVDTQTKLNAASLKRIEQSVKKP